MIKVLHPGIYCTIQDEGRLGFAKMGVPQAGAMDAYAAKQASILLNHYKQEAVIEITYGQGKFEFTSNTLIALTGADFSPKLNLKPIQMNGVYAVQKGDVLTFGERKYGARVYLGVQGGIQSDVVLNSKSYFPGITLEKLNKGELIHYNSIKGAVPKSLSKVKLFQEHFTESDLVCYPGPEFERLNSLQKQRLFKAFRVSEDNNRVGYRLNEAIANDLPPILTSAVLPGTVQLTPSGKLIVLMRDCQVTGGYPRVLQLSDYAVSRLSQKIAGDEIRFVLDEKV